MNRGTEIIIEPATAADHGAIAALLRAANLPYEDILPHWPHFLVARRGRDLVGAVGAEVCGEDALLRSLVVTPAARGEGWGGKLCDELERAAESWSVRR